MNVADLDNDRLELMERQLAERVTERIRPALFRLYATVGLAVIGVLGFVSWDIITDIKAEIKTEITDEIDKEIKEKRDKILQRLAETNFMADRANKIILEVEKQLDDFRPQAKDLDETIKQVKELNIRSRDLVAIYAQELDPLASNVESLTRQLKVLAEQVNQLNTITSDGGISAPVEPTQTPEVRTATIQSVISETKAAEQRLVDARKRTTVFFQFAGGRREQAEAIAASLNAKGYIVPGEDREGGAAHKHEVRYFHDEDKAAAQRLAEDTTSVLRSLGYPDGAPRDIVVKSLVSYPGKKPRVGVLELWIEIPPR